MSDRSPARPWTAERLAACFADRLALPPVLMQGIRAAAFGVESLHVAGPHRQAIASLLAATGLYLAGVPLGDLRTLYPARADLIAEALAALDEPEKGWRCLYERGTVTVTVQFPASFLVYLGIVAARIAEESNVAA